MRAGAVGTALRALLFGVRDRLREAQAPLEAEGEVEVRPEVRFFAVAFRVRFAFVSFSIHLF